MHKNIHSSKFSYVCPLVIAFKDAKWDHLFYLAYALILRLELGQKLVSKIKAKFVDDIYGLYQGSIELNSYGNCFHKIYD